MIDSENLFFIYRENLSTHMKESIIIENVA